MSATLASPPPPQLQMRRATLERLPPIALPPGYSVRHFRPGDAAAWDRIFGEAFNTANPAGCFDRIMRHDFCFRPARVWFACHDDVPVATASAWWHPPRGRATGYLHYVGTQPAEQGKKLGLYVSVAAMQQMVAEGRTCAILQTDDFRLSAISIYLRLDFAPVLVHENQRQRWRDVFAALKQPELAERFAAVLDGPVVPPLPAGRPDQDKVEKYQPRHQWLAGRQHRGGSVGGGDIDAFADESLYRPSRLGQATVSPAAVVAGAPVSEPLLLRYVAGPAGVPTGAAVGFAIRGQWPLGFALHLHDTTKPGYMTLAGPAHCRLEPWRLGFRVVAGELRDGDTVELRLRELTGLRWNPVARRREFRVFLELAAGEPQVRLPAPVVLDFRPGPATRVEVLAPATHLPGADLLVTLAHRDANDNRGREDSLVMLATREHSCPVVLHGGRCEVSAPSDAELVTTLTAEHNGRRYLSNPSVAVTDQQLYIGDLHCHDFLSEAEEYPDRVYQWAREDRRLDFVSVVPQSHGWHDNEKWAIVKYMNERQLEEGRFVTFLGFEWQHTGYGDKVVHYLGGDQPYLPVDDGRFNEPAKLYEALRTSDALVISHHSAYPANAWCPMTDFAAVEPDVERLIELWSMHGSSEGYDDRDRPLIQHNPAGTVYAAWRRGVRLGVVAGSDTHSGRPGGSVREPRPYWGGLAAVWAPSLTRRDLFAALRRRQTYGLTGARIVLRFAVNGALMGAELPAAPAAQVSVQAWAPAPIAKVEVMKNTAVLRTFTPRRRECKIELEDRTGGPAFYHCRVTLKDGHLAVCSPVWLG